jgi:sugar porter (SP) family MFS transporter
MLSRAPVVNACHKSNFLSSSSLFVQALPFSVRIQSSIGGTEWSVQKFRNSKAIPHSMHHLASASANGQRRGAKTLSAMESPRQNHHNQAAAGSRVSIRISAYQGDPPAEAETGDGNAVVSITSPSLLLPVLVAGCGAFAFGFHLGVINGPLEALSRDLGVAGNATLQGLVVSSVLAGAAVGSLGGSGLADAWGRRKTLLADAAPLLVGALICAAATGPAGMIFGRFLVGIGIGISSALVPLYISEIAPPSLRGALGSTNQLLICIGILAALMVNVVIPSTAWRSMFALSALPAIGLALGMVVCPETPSYLASAGRRAEADVVARRLWGPGTGTHSEQSDGPIPTDSNFLAPAGWKEVLAAPTAKIGVILFLLQQFAGINAIVYFSSAVFAKAGVTSGTLASAVVGVVNVLGTIFAAGLIDKTGRKILLTWSFAGMGISMLAMALGLSTAASSTIAVLGTVAYIAAFAMGAGPVPGVLVPEVNPARVRGRAVALAMGAHWLSNFAIGQLFLSAVAAVGVAWVYAAFAVVCFLAVWYVERGVVETKGRL